MFCGIQSSNRNSNCIVLLHNFFPISESKPVPIKNNGAYRNSFISSLTLSLFSISVLLLFNHQWLGKSQKWWKNAKNREEKLRSVAKNVPRGMNANEISLPIMKADVTKQGFPRFNEHSASEFPDVIFRLQKSFLWHFW